MKLPTWKEAKENIDLDAGTPLDTFIFNYEPMNEEADEWREKLAHALTDFTEVRVSPNNSPEVPDYQMNLDIDPDKE